MGRKKSMKHGLLNLDIFGYPVSLYYDESNRKKNSIIGVIFSTIMLMIGILYFATQVN